MSFCSHAAKHLREPSKPPLARRIKQEPVMSEKTQCKVAIVTGGSSGIGLATAKHKSEAAHAR